MLVGQPADDMSKRRGIEIVANEHFTTALRRKYWEQNKRGPDLDKDGDFGTVGAVVLDRYGNLAAGGSTGGTSGKSRGRIGDTAILGAGLYADSKVAVVW
jgi:beta-aspartyl-peptidase (threonine type)